MADTHTLARSRADITRAVDPGTIDSLQRDAARNYAMIAAEVIKSPHFHLWQIVKQNAATQDPAAKYLKALGAVRMRDVLPIEDYFSAVAQSSQQSENGRGGRSAPERETLGNRG